MQPTTSNADETKNTTVGNAEVNSGTLGTSPAVLQSRHVTAMRASSKKASTRSAVGVLMEVLMVFTGAQYHHIEKKAA